MAYTLFKNRGTKGKNGDNANKHSELRVPHWVWDKIGTKKAWDSWDTWDSGTRGTLGTGGTATVRSGLETGARI